MDVKKIGKIPDGGGWKAHGRQMGRTGAQKRAKIGFDYVHSLVDDHCRLAYSEILPDEKGLNAKHVFIRPHCPWQNGKVERYNRTLQGRVGIPAGLPHQRRAQQRSCPLARVLQHWTTPLSHRRPSPDQPTAMNVSGEYI